MIKCKKTPGENVEQQRRGEKKRLPIGCGNVRKGSRKMRGEVWMDIRSDRQKGLSHTEVGKKYHMTTCLPWRAGGRCSPLAD